MGRGFLPILQYHCIAPDGEGARFSRSTIRPEAFARQVDWLAARGWTALTLADAWSRFPDRLPPRPVVFTFDDGYADARRHAFPCLARHGWPATVFCCPGLMEETGNAVPERWGAPILSFAEARELLAAGWEIGAHTLTHPKLPGLTPAERRREIGESRAQLAARCGVEPATFAYPHGLLDGGTEALVAEAGFLCAVGVEKGNRHLAGERFRLRRVFVRPDTQGARLAHRLGLWYDLHHRLRRWLAWTQRKRRS